MAYVKSIKRDRRVTVMLTEGEFAWIAREAAERDISRSSLAQEMLQSQIMLRQGAR